MSFPAIFSELETLGLTPFFRQQLLARFAEWENTPLPHAGRIVCERRGEYDVQTAERALRATLSGRLSHELASDARPAVGDWVLVEPAEPVGRIHDVLERQSVLRRLDVGGSSRAQTLAANVDSCFVVCALSPDSADRHVARRALNPRRIERYLAVARDAHVPALVVVNKADLASEPERWLEGLARELSGVETLLVSAESGRGLEALREQVPRMNTAVLLGSSGVGKSSLMNRLLERPVLRTGSVRDDDARGRHTTTERELHALPDGGMLIDTPGMRELGLWVESDADAEATGFADVDELAAGCRFGDCNHRNEPGCAVRAALDDGTLSAARLEHARKLERERLFQRSRGDARLRREANQKQRAISRFARARTKAKRGDD
jgi:ribosome biogenesis GTPase / thiamine phosphate phosphatase